MVITPLFKLMADKQASDMFFHQRRAHTNQDQRRTGFL